MNKKSVSRSDHEIKEGMDTIKNEVPENKFQADQQVADTDAALKVQPAPSSFTANKSKVKGATLKQQAIADVITGSAGSAGMGISAAGRGVSGTNGGILGANNSTPIAGKSRSDSRVGKKLDRTATKLNYTPCEQTIVEVDESKPLADAAGEDQGYNGTYRNESARSQKIMGAVPGDLMFQRSVDLITKDKLYFVEGQQVFQAAADKHQLNPSKTHYNGIDKDVTYHSGNFLHRALRFGLDEHGKVEYFVAEVADLTPNNAVDPEIANVSSAHRLIKSNVAEIDRQVMDSKAGDEKADIWSPLGRAVPEPTKTAYLMSSIEADTGAYAYLAYSKATTNMSFQMNRGPKDGLDEVTPAIEECVGWRYDATDNTTIGNDYANSLESVFNSADYSKGDPAIMIDAYDSKAKYKNKADLLLQPRGFRMHLQTADNNINPLKVPAEFAAVYTGQETFSTIDHEYDPILPICMTDKANLVTVHNFNELAGFVTVRDVDLILSSTNIEAKYKYTPIKLIPANVIGLLNYENLYVHYSMTDEDADGLVYDSNTGVISMNPDSHNNVDNMFSIIVSTEPEVEGYNLLATVPNNAGFDVVFNAPKAQNEGGTVITEARLIKTPHKLYHRDAGPFGYFYSDLRNNYIVNVDHPLIMGIIEYLNNSVGQKFYQLLGSKKELFIPMVFSTQYMTLAQLIICAATPWITRVRTNSMKDVIYYEDNIHEYPYSKLNSIKDVPFHNYVNFTFTGYDDPLDTKVMNPVTAIQWVMPEFFWKIADNKYVLPWYFNENEFLSVDDGLVNLDASAMSFPSIRSGIRLGALDTFYGMSEKDVRLALDRLTKFILVPKASHISHLAAYKYGRNTDGQPYVELNSNDLFTIADVLECPRELGLCMDAPYHLFYQTVSGATNVLYPLTSEFASSFAVKIWTNRNTPLTPDVLSSAGVNINRAANYVQKWFKLNAATANTDTVLTGLVLGMNDEGAAEFKPYGALKTGVQYADGPAIISLQRSLWTRIQLLPFIISPFDGHPTTGAAVRDIYDFAYMFGLCGFRASDYRESVYNREKEVINQGLLFTQDPWVLDSPIVRNGATSSGVSITSGYEIKRA